MIGKVVGIICLVAFVFGLATGNISAVGNAVLDGAAGAVELTVSLCGIMCLWGGIMQVLTDAGAIRVLARLLSPVLKLFFPDAAKSGEGADEIAASIGANLLGVGNAATPLALRAMEKLQKSNPTPDTASPDMITLSVLNTASLSLLPSTIVALRRAAGATEPFAVVVPVWICSGAGALLALLLCRGMVGLRKR